MNSYNSKTRKTIIKVKMRVLEDFGVCHHTDQNMIHKLEQAIDAKPDRDPREVVDYYCRPLIQQAMAKWT